MEYMYTIIYHGRPIVNLNDHTIAEEAIAELGGTSYIRYNEPAIEEYEEEKRWH